MYISLLFFAVAGSAQSFHNDSVSDQEEPTWISEKIVVTGESLQSYNADQSSLSKSNIPLLEQSQSIQVLTTDLLQEQQILTLSEALSNLSGVVPNDPAETVLVNPIVRGFESEIYIDGLISYGDSAVVDPSSMVGFERVEVAKGPTSVLFGGGTGAPVGGLINLVTKTPNSVAHSDFAVTAGNDDFASLQMDINQPIASQSAFRLVAEIRESDDFIDQVEIDRFAIYPSFSYQINDDTRFLLRSYFTQIKQLEYTGLPAVVADNPLVDPFQFTGAADAPRTEIDNQSVHLSLDHDFNTQMRGVVQARYFKNTFDEFGSFPFLSVFPVEGTEVPIIKGFLPVETTEWTLDAYINYLFETGATQHNMLIGLTYDTTEYKGGSAFDFTPIGVFDYAGNNAIAFGAIPIDVRRGNNDYQTLALYIQDQISFSEQSHLMLSGRFSRYSLQETGEFNPSQPDESYTSFDPRIGYTYMFNPHVSWFAGVATGSRLSIFFSGENTPELEESESIETGVKFDIPDRGVSGTVALYHMKRDNIPSTNPQTFLQEQTGEQKSRGAEIDIIWEPSANVSLLTSLAYTDASIEEDIVSFGAVFAAGNALSRVPKRSGRIAGRYRFTEGALNGLGVGLGMTYSESAPLTEANAFFSDSYTVYDLQASYQIHDYALELKLVNLTDKEYFTPYQYLQQDVVRPGQPRSVYLTLRAQF